MNCDQCHLDYGIKSKSGGVRQVVHHEATWVVSVNGAKLNLCDDHKAKFERATSRKDIKCTSREL
jgi:hypothetical protein